jgi:putative ABC transport system permease protein
MAVAPAPNRFSPRTPPLALRNVAHARVRSLIAVAGIGFATVMVLLQLGFLEAVKVTASVNYDQLDFDVALVSPEFEQFYEPGSFPGERLSQAESLPEVADARPLYARMSSWRCPPYPVTASAAARTPPQPGALKRWWLGDRRPRPLQVRDLLVLGIDLAPAKNPFREPILGQVERARPMLRKSGRVLMNEWSNPDFGWNDRHDFSGWELGGQSVVVVGGFTLERSFGADAAVLCDDRNFAWAFHVPHPAPVNFGLVKLAKGADAADTARRLDERLPPDVKVLTRAELLGIEQDYWVRQTATGKIFAFGVFVTMVVAAVVVYQVLSNDVRDHLAEYATLKAMGHTNGYLSGVVLVQAAVYATAAYVPAVALGYVLYRVTDALANIPMVMTAGNLGLVLALNLAAALVSGFLTLGRVRSADPADLF